MATDRTVTVKSSGGDYATLQAALAGEQGDLVSLDRRLIIDCYSFADSTQVDTAAHTWTTDATRYVLIKANTSHGGVWNTGVYRHVYSGSTYGCNFDGIAYLHLQGLQFRYTGSSSGTKMLELDANATGWIKIEKCIVVDDGTGTSTTGIYPRDSASTYYIWNTIIYGCSAYGIEIIASSANEYIYNVTIDDCATGLDTAAASRTRMKNCRITACTTVVNEASGALHSDSNYNLTDGTAPTNWGANSIDSTDTPTIDYTDDDNATLTSRDYHIGATDSGVGAGTDLSGDGALAFTDDIDGDTRG